MTIFIWGIKQAIRSGDNGDCGSGRGGGRIGVIGIKNAKNKFINFLYLAMKQRGVSKVFIIVVIFLIGGAVFGFWGKNKAYNQLKDYDTALKDCGLNSSFTEDELLAAQKCACDKGDKISCDFIILLPRI
ncbi:MAG: hypothetical protein COZ49_03785 [Candidatus Yonathbacteria bacterium CG_4_10_14_3_um_filter_47_65]|uniref:Uncharacterized protein n=2 Tax=Parcubacteria group TaxID=1794811 RepID=A0A2M8D9V5_9BACT|nr:MAG: hypothetical protein AUJ44_04170 [Candidatus Nomurabacteria bacterium CG1_02_47_685]PIP04221.1 MAG: hypothetical protein COX54_00215 [Candidatus Yonathbacteria bacterium CG23_combo_of_CG06-09_8_20_14_all_46_18]PIQ31613.1 MAG: hypothetical protein COW61_03505 [Candidatus Yonathbacteria bacterium CG17_big_fil_post_rev_8_21_14_2_50_46_19]PIX56128.1 MAG: hypothetical protein COZ49_03785 [Candidatus Yonathbacteria bacterium CG_4_10_14_3_um_filter_47_65]PIY57692.1 MAG: hypothetical protein CO